MGYNLPLTHVYLHKWGCELEGELRYNNSGWHLARAWPAHHLQRIPMGASLFKKLRLVCLLLESSSTTLRPHSILVVKFSFFRVLSRCYLNSPTCGHCPDYCIGTKDGEEIYARVKLLFSSFVSLFLCGQHICSHIHKTNSFLQLELIAFFLAVTEDMPEMGPASFFPPTILKHWEEEAAPYLFVFSKGCHSPIPRHKYLQLETSRNHSYIEGGLGSWTVTVHLNVVPLKLSSLSEFPRKGILFLRASSHFFCEASLVHRKVSQLSLSSSICESEREKPSDHFNCPFFKWWWVFLSSRPCFSLHGPNAVDPKEQRNEKDEAEQTRAVDPSWHQGCISDWISELSFLMEEKATAFFFPLFLFKGGVFFSLRIDAYHSARLLL